MAGEFGEHLKSKFVLHSLRFSVSEMFHADTLTLIIAHIRCTKTLLRLRSTCRAARDELSIERIVGMPIETLKLFVRPDARHVMGRSQTVWSDDIGACFADNGREFWTWANTTCGKVTIDHYAAEDEWKAVATYEANVPAATYLWLHVTDGGLICTLSVVDDALPIVFHAFKCDAPHAVLQTELDNNLLLTLQTEIESSMLFGMDDDAPVVYRFHKENVLFASWRDRSFLAIMPNSHLSLGLLHIKDEGKWVWWDVCQVHAMCQTGQRIYAMTCDALLALDLEAEDPEPTFVDTLPLLPAAASSMKVNSICIYLHMSSVFLYFIRIHNNRSGPTISKSSPARTVRCFTWPIAGSDASRASSAPSCL